MTEKEKYVLYQKLDSEGFRKIDIARELGFEGKRPDTAMRNWLKNYEAVIHVKESVGTEIIEKEEKLELADDKSHTSLMRFFQEQENMEILKSIIEREKQKDKVMTEVILIDDNILNGDQVRTTVRLDKGIDAAFTEFCNKNKQYTKYQLMSQALKEFVNKYEGN